MANQRSILDAARSLPMTDAAVSFDTVARAAGLTKAGLMHYFRSKEDLMIALVDAAADTLDTQLTEAVGDPASVDAAARVRGYAQVCIAGGFDTADLAMLADPRLRAQLVEHWNQRMHRWVHLEDVTDLELRARLAAVRLLADGAWFADAADCFPLPDTDRPQLLAAVDRILEETPS